VRILAEVHYSLNLATEYFFLAKCYKRLLNDKVVFFVVAESDGDVISLVPHGVDESSGANGRNIDVSQEFDDFNLRFCLFLNNSKLVLEYCAIDVNSTL
jgi:hypothetical protein